MNKLVAYITLLILSVSVSQAAIQSETVIGSVVEGRESSINIDDVVVGQSITPHIYIYKANSATDNLELVNKAWHSGLFSRTSRDTISVSMSQEPVWARLELYNPQDHIQQYKLMVGASWVDFVDVYFLVANQQTLHWKTGDEVAGAPYFEPAVVYIASLPIPPGKSVVYVRAQSIDPLALTLSLAATEEFTTLVSRESHAYGLLYGFLLAFILYNLILYSALKQKRLLLYSLYLMTFLVMNLSYTGRSMSWLWADIPEINRYAMPFFMVMLPFCGLLFARSALEMDKLASRLSIWVKGLQWAGLLLLLPAIVFDAHEAAAWIGFGSLTIFIPTMVVLGVVMLKHGQIFSRYFLAAAITAMAGSAITEFAIWGFIPFTSITFHAMEFGMMLDAFILAVGLSQHVRQQRKQRKQAELMARVDALTNLFNRRGFYEVADPQSILAVRHSRPLSLIMIDLDHFKPLNDHYGHNVGDRVLVEFGKLISQNLRTNDIAARWGGEEFVVLLPETSVSEANTLAERLREMTLEIELEGSFPAGTLSASFGIAALTQEQTLEAMMAAADSALYKAKSLGRDRVEIYSN